MTTRNRQGDESPNQSSIIDALAQDARDIRSARMLPTNRTLTPEEIAQVGRDVNRFAKETRRTLASIAKSLGISASTLSTFCNHKSQTGDCEELARKLNAFIAMETSRGEQTMPKGFVETNVAERMLTAIRTTMNASAMGLAYGGAGLGKSMVIDAAEKMIPGSISHRVMQSTKRGPGLVHAIANKLGVARSNTFELRQSRIIESLKGTSRLILIDEAHQLATGGIEVLRDIHDAAGVPIFLVGTVDLRKRMDDATMFFGQLSSRIAVRLEIDAAMTRTRSPRPLFTTDEIMKLFAGQQLRITSDGTAFLTDLANTPGLGALRLVKQVVGVAARVARSKGQPITADLLRKVIAQLHDLAFIDQAEARGERSGLKVRYA